MKLAKLYIYSFLDTFFIYMPYLALYLSTVKGLSDNQIAVVFSAFSFTVFIFEIPTGFVADKIGENKSIIIGFGIRMLGIVLLTLSQTFSALLLGEALLGLGTTFSSGADQSLVYKIVHEDQKLRSRYKDIVSTYYTINWISLSVAFLFGQMLAMASLHLVFIASIVFTAIGLLVSLTLPNASGGKAFSDSFSILADAVRDIRSNKKLLGIFFIASFILAVLASSYILFQPYLNELKLAGKNNGMIFFVITLFAILGSRIQPFLATKYRTDFIIPLLFMLGITVMAIGIVKGFFVLLLFCVFRFIWGITTPLVMGEINKVIEFDRSRSTILSIRSLFSSLLQGFILLCAGVMGGMVYIKLVLIGALVFLLSLLLFLSRARKNNPQ